MAANPIMAEEQCRPRRRWRGPHLSLAVFSLGLAAWAGSRIAPLLPWFRDRAYGDGLGSALSAPLSRLTGAVPFSVAEALILTYALWLALLGVRGLGAGFRRRRGWRDLLVRSALRAARHAGVFLVLFYLLWGMNYARPPFAVQSAWGDWEGIDDGELSTLLEQATRTANRAYIALHGSADAGEATRMTEQRSALDAAIDEGWRRTAHRLRLPASATTRFGAVKWPGSSSILARFGISGIYIPFTGEATVVRDLPAMYAPFAMSHEKAHQRGVAREADANFLGYVAASLAPDPLARYAAALFARQQLYRHAVGRLPVPELRRYDESFVRGIRRDRAAMLAYWQKHERSAPFGIDINHAFLRANGIDGGVQDYSRSVFLIIGWARRNGGDILPPDSVDESVPAP